MTGGAAMAQGLTDRGTIAEGKVADLVIFDPNVIADQATYDDPHQYPNGIETVIVNGVTVIDRGEHTGALPGRLLAPTRRDPRQLIRAVRGRTRGASLQPVITALTRLEATARRRRRPH